MVEIRLSELKAKLDAPAASNSEHHHFPKLLPKINQTLWLQGFQNMPGGGRGGNDRGEVHHLSTIRVGLESPSPICMAKLQCEPWQRLTDTVWAAPRGLCGVPALFDGWSDYLPGDDTSEWALAGAGVLGDDPQRTSVHLQKLPSQGLTERIS